MEKYTDGTSTTLNDVEKDQAVTLTFSEHAAVEHKGPVIQELFENFPRPIYELAQIVAKDMAEKKGVWTIV